ncbi:hypothetical protein [Frigidibacter sp. MR17.24]|uniref:hypothetical protein n=1 Tax=Frigidibacter sp. MR17.24 TaxID=3127345 RepID=UPI003012F06D
MAAGAVAGLGGTPARADAPLRVSVDGRALIVTGPSGYCVDRDAAQSSEQGAVIVLGSCAALGGGRAAPDGPPAILTAAVAYGDRGDGGALLDQLESYFATAAGQAALSRSGDGAGLTVLESRREGDALLLRIEDSGPGGIADVAPRYWRAVLVLRGRLVTLSALSPQARPLGDAALEEVLAAFAARMAQVNRRATP